MQKENSESMVMIRILLFGKAYIMCREQTFIAFMCFWTF